MRTSTKTAAIVAALLVLASAAAFAAPIKHLTMGTAGVSGTNYPTGIAACQLWNQNIAGIKAVAIATNGSPHNIDLLRTKDIDVAQCRSLEAYRAINGIAPYPEKMPWIRAITGGLFADMFQVVARKRANITSVADFKGKRIAVGPVGSGGEVDARETLAAYGLTYKDMNGAILGLALGASGMTELMLDNKTVILPITDQALANLKKVNVAYMRRNIPANTSPNQTTAIPTVGTPPDVIIVRQELDDDLVYKMTKTLYENLPTMQAVTANLKQFTKDLVLPDDQMLVPYHPAARKYFVEQGWLKP